MNVKSITDLLNNSTYSNPVIVKNKYGFTKFWKDKGINFLSWGKNWIDREPSTIDIDSAAEIVLKCKIGML
jgi:hypothetical protein